MLASQVTLDSALYESYQKILLSGRSLVFAYPTMHTQVSSIPAGSSSPAPSSASLPAVADLGSTHPHPDRNICIYIDDMMMGTRSLELELRSPAS